MKERLLKMGVTLLVVAALVVCVVPVQSHAASKTTYNVVLVDPSPTVSLVVQLANATAGATMPASMIPTSFQIQVENKVKTEKVKSTGGTASYYPVTLIAKSYKGPTVTYEIPGAGTATNSSKINGDAKGKLYISGSPDVDVNQVQGDKKATVKIGDGKADTTGSMILPIKMESNIVLASGKKFMQTKMQITLTTGSSYVIAKNTKATWLNGKALPDNDTSNTLLKPLVGVPVDLTAGTGTLVGTLGAMNVKSQIGTVDYLIAQVWKMQITKK